ncbi:MAG: ATP-binding cassette domain-containing protein [Planctomycetes bacterium]|nr:ATP-binding cassette domain-containing protein [Planctomycetota bacterium]
MPLIEVRNLTKAYGDVAALADVTLSIEKGEWIAIMGPSGSGKTTLVNMLGALDRPTSGRVVFDGRDISTLSSADLAVFRRENIGLVFQQFHLVPYLTALENVMLAQYLHSMADEEEARKALASVGLGERLRHLPSQLSGGEQQRVCVARALINHPKLILADEPTGNLDEANAALVLGLFMKLHNAGHTIIMVTHSPDVGRLANRRFELRHGHVRAEVRSSKEEEELFEDVLQQLWERQEAGADANACADTPNLLENRSLLMAMQQKGLVVADNGGFALSRQGVDHARDVIRRHRLAERLFQDTFEIRSNEQIESNACVLEHVLSPEVTNSICKFLGHPKECPHKRPIPGGECCERSGKFPKVNNM